MVLVLGVDKVIYIEIEEKFEFLYVVKLLSKIVE